MGPNCALPDFHFEWDSAEGHDQNCLCHIHILDLEVPQNSSWFVHHSNPFDGHMQEHQEPDHREDVGMVEEQPEVVQTCLHSAEEEEDDEMLDHGACLQQHLSCAHQLWEYQLCLHVSDIPHVVIHEERHHLEHLWDVRKVDYGVEKGVTVEGAFLFPLFPQCFSPYIFSYRMSYLCCVYLA